VSRPWGKSPPPRRRSFNRLLAVAAEIEAGGEPAALAAEIRAIAKVIREGNRQRRAKEKQHDRT